MINYVWYDYLPENNCSEEFLIKSFSNSNRDMQLQKINSQVEHQEVSWIWCKQQQRQVNLLHLHFVLISVQLQYIDKPGTSNRLLGRTPVTWQVCVLEAMIHKCNGLLHEEHDLFPSTINTDFSEINVTSRFVVHYTIQEVFRYEKIKYVWFTNMKEFVNFSPDIFRIIWHKCIQRSFVKNYTELTVTKCHIQGIHLLINHITAILSMNILHLLDYNMTDVNICYMSEINIKNMRVHIQCRHSFTYTEIILIPMLPVSCISLT